MNGKRRAAGCVTQKRGLWYAVLTGGRTNKGRQGRLWSNGFKTRRAAEHALAQMLLEGRTEQRSHQTVQSIVSAYIEHDVTARGKRSPTTTSRYRGLLKNMVSIADAQVDKLDGAAIEAFYTSLLRNGLSSTTVHHVVNLMSASFRWAKTRKVGLITSNPFDWDDIEKPHRLKSNANSLTIGQAQKALESLTSTKHTYALVFCLATACRRVE